MRVLLVVHGFADEMRGGTETSVLALARALQGAGHTPVVLAGSDRHDLGAGLREDRFESPDAPPLQVLRIQRTDPFYGHWQKGRSLEVGDCFEEVLRRERPALVHVHHWQRLSRDLVTRAAMVGVPAVVTLHDFSTSCLVIHRIRPGSLVPCDALLAPDPCIACANSVYPATPWVDAAEAERQLAFFREDFRRELALARGVAVLSRAQADVLRHHFPDATWRVVPPFPALALPRARVPDARTNAAPRLTLGAWGSIHPIKGLDIVVAAARRAVEAGVEVELRMAGQVSDAAFLEALRRDAAPVDLRWLGPFPAGGLVGHPVTEVDLFVSGTRARETWGVVLDEAHQLGLPMILPRHGAYAERFVEGVGARFYRPLDAADLSRVLVEIANEPGAASALRDALPAAPSPFDEQRRHLAATLELYEEALTAGAPSLASIPALDRAADARWAANWDRHASPPPPTS